MNQVKIGNFIKEKRKEKNLTQEQLAKKLFITDRAVSKWETGLSLPDADKMIELCNNLDINVNELLLGEEVNMKDYKRKTEELLLELAKQDEIKNKKLMASMWTILIVSFLFYIGILLISVTILEKGFILGIIILLSTILFLVAGFIAFKFELDAGYYECKNCHHKFIPSYKAALLAMHISTTRFLKCPECGKRTWAKKVMNNK